MTGDLNPSATAFLEWAEGALERGLLTEKEANDRAVLLATLDNVERAQADAKGWQPRSLSETLERQLGEDDEIKRRMRAVGEDPDALSFEERRKRVLTLPATESAKPASRSHEEQRRLVDGATFLKEQHGELQAIWGRADQVLWIPGEALFIAAPQGTGKTTLAQQLMLARLGLREEVLGFPVEPDMRPVLYIAADRPRQIRRSLARMVAEDEIPVLEERLLVWTGPLPFDIGVEPPAFAAYAKELGVGCVFIDSLKDVALDLVKDETGSRVNAAFQDLIADGIELVVLHHQRKQQAGGVSKPKSLADVYGSTWLTAGAGSVLLLWGEPGDLVVELKHLKQPAEEVGPFTIVHDHARGVSTISEQVDVEKLLWQAGASGLSVADAASGMFGLSPTRNETEKARRRLERLVKEGKARKPEPLAGASSIYISTGAGIADQQ
jgi:hypothetical protein